MVLGLAGIGGGIWRRPRSITDCHINRSGKLAVPLLSCTIYGGSRGKAKAAASGHDSLHHHSRRGKCCPPVGGGVTSRPPPHAPPAAGRLRSSIWVRRDDSGNVKLRPSEASKRVEFAAYSDDATILCSQKNIFLGLPSWMTGMMEGESSDLTAENDLRRTLESLEHKPAWEHVCLARLVSLFTRHITFITSLISRS
ncbi:hypothetical protein E2C01_040475 [Portunus trituberculatus]|uniref:Uncharacterized protein n=1 Tax=Portunus trituberculatus TaxID=210409 RepID=A0A5B7FNE2_PORTR|nr:hypothetical protein [Portunus trituberculatus]